MANLISGWTIKSIEDGAEGTDLTDEFACINPASLRSQLGNGRISSVFVDRANSYYCPWGYPYGQAWLLVDGKTLSQLKLNKRQQVRCYITEVGGSSKKNERNQNRELSFNSLYLQRAICVAGAVTQTAEDNYPHRSLIKPFHEERNNTDVFLLELVDLRYILKKFTCLNKGYNVLCRATVPYVAEVIDSSSGKEKFFYKQTLEDRSLSFYLYTVKKLLNNIFESIPEDLRHGFSSITDRGGGVDTNDNIRPINVEYYGWNCWDALIDFSKMWGTYICFDPTSGEFFRVLTDGVFYDSSQDLFLEKPEIIDYINSQRIYDYRVFENPCVMFPETIRGISSFTPMHLGMVNCWECNTDDPRRAYWPNRYRATDSDYESNSTYPGQGYNFKNWVGKLGKTGVIGSSNDIEPIPGTIEKFIDPYPRIFQNRAFYSGTSGLTPYGGYLDPNFLGESYRGNTLTAGLVTDGENIVYMERNTSGFFGKRIYQGIAHFYRDSNSKTPTYLIPNHQTGHLIWRDYGDGQGLVTESLVLPSPNLLVGQKTSGAEALSGLTPSLETNSIPRNSGFHVWPSSESSACPTRTQDLTAQQLPETALLMYCLTFPPDGLELGKITGSGGITGANGIVLFPGDSSMNSADFANNSQNENITPSFGSNFGPPCKIEFADTLAGITPHYTFPDYSQKGNISGPGPLWHGRIFTGKFMHGGSGAGYPTFLVTQFFYPVLDVELLADASSTGSVSADGPISGSATIKCLNTNWGVGSATLYFPSNPMYDSKSGSPTYSDQKIAAGTYKALVTSSTTAYALSAAHSR